VATCNDYGFNIAKLVGLSNEAEFKLIFALLSKIRLKIWHSFMDKHSFIATASSKTF
jgi:hypothetical protein